MIFISLLTGKIYQKLEKRRLKNFPAGYVGSFYVNLADNCNNFIGSDFYGKIARDAGIHSQDVQKYILATTDFAKGIQVGINYYVTKNRINNASFRQKLDPFSKNILRRQNPLELFFEDIAMFDAENTIVGSLLKELNVGKKDIANELIKKAPQPPGIDFEIQNRLEKLRNRQEPKGNNNNNDNNNDNNNNNNSNNKNNDNDNDNNNNNNNNNTNNNNLSPPLSPPPSLFPPSALPSTSFFQGSSSLNIPPASPFVSPTSGRFL